MGKEALIVKRDILFKEKQFQGFSKKEEYDFIPIILGNFEYYLRGNDLENNINLQQIIPYVWIINLNEKKVFAYKRASGKQNYSEERLMNKISCGVGGHVDKEDLISKGGVIIKAMMRELMEEVKMKKYPKPKIIGFLNDDADSVGRVHFGIVAIAETKEVVSKRDSEMAHGQFYSVDELEKLFADPANEVENWTKMSWPFVKDYLKSI